MNQLQPPVPTPDGYECLAEVVDGDVTFFLHVYWHNAKDEFYDSEWIVKDTDEALGVDDPILHPLPGWRKPDVAPVDEPLRILVEGAFRLVIDGRQGTDGRWVNLDGSEIPFSLRILAWKHADSTELPEDWRTR